MLDSGFDQLVQPNDNVGVEESFSWFQVAGLFRERDRLKKERHQKLWIGGCPRRIIGFWMCELIGWAASTV
jgi:hypothetical protein